MKELTQVITAEITIVTGFDNENHLEKVMQIPKSGFAEAIRKQIEVDGVAVTNVQNFVSDKSGREKQDGKTDIV